MSGAGSKAALLQDLEKKRQVTRVSPRGLEISSRSGCGRVEVDNTHVHGKGVY